MSKPQRKRIAYLIDGELGERKGLVNTTLNRVKHLKAIADYDVIVYSIQTYSGWLVRFLKKTPKHPRSKEVEVEGLTIKLWWNRFSILKYLLDTRLKMRLKGTRIAKRRAKQLSGYDLISAHSLECDEIARIAGEEYDIPYVASWYGSDVHTSPFRSEDIKRSTVEVMEHAALNFICSKDLMKKSDLLTTNAAKELLYNPLRDGLSRFTDSKRQSLREKYNVDGVKVVAFGGGLVAVKNPLVLPDIYSRIEQRYEGAVKFWIIGNGKLKNQIEQRADSLGLSIEFWGYVPDEVLPELLNCVDVLVLPSLNEGLPIITIEALACGANVVGSNVGGIPEAIGERNVFDLNASFVSSIADRAVELLNNAEEQPLSEVFLSERVAETENSRYQQIMSR